MVRIYFDDNEIAILNNYDQSMIEAIVDVLKRRYGPYRSAGIRIDRRGES